MPRNLSGIADFSGVRFEETISDLPRARSGQLLVGDHWDPVIANQRFRLRTQIRRNTQSARRNCFSPWKRRRISGSVIIHASKSFNTFLVMSTSPSRGNLFFTL